MEQWILVMALMAGNQMGGRIVELGPMQSMELCLKVAYAIELTSKGEIFAGCTVTSAAKEPDHESDEKADEKAGEEPEPH
jgi:hypothetical protein